MLSISTTVSDLFFQEMLKGNAYVMSSDLTLAASGVTDFHIKTGVRDIIIYGVSVSVDGAETLVQGFAESTVSANGAGFNVQAQNRSTNRQPDTVNFYSAPTITDDGEEVIHMVAYGETQGSKTKLANASEGLWFLLKKNSSNLFRITNRDGASSVKVSYKLQFIEVEL
jgi:hypothetical protein